MTTYKASKTGAPRGKCPRCEKILTLTWGTNGKLRAHNITEDTDNGTRSRRCPGSHGYPVAP